MTEVELVVMGWAMRAGMGRAVSVAQIIECYSSVPMHHVIMLRAMANLVQADFIKLEVRSASLCRITITRRGMAAIRRERAGLKNLWGTEVERWDSWSDWGHLRIVKK